MNSTRLAIIVGVVLTCLSAPAAAQKGGHGGGHASSARSSAGTVHVRGYTRKDGTVVAPYDRRGPHAPGDMSLADIAKQTTKAGSGSGAVKTVHPSDVTGHPAPFGSTTGHSEYSHGAIYSVTDPATGRRTYTNHLPSASAMTPSTPSVVRVSPRSSVSVSRSAHTVSPRTLARSPSRASSNARLTAAPRSVVHRSDRCTNCDRDAHGRILRSEQAKDAFERATGYPHGRPGYVIDHIVPLACGGSDSPSNMQWQTVAEGKAKDKTERKGCEH